MAPAYEKLFGLKLWNRIFIAFLLKKWEIFNLSSSLTIKAEPISKNELVLNLRHDLMMTDSLGHYTNSI